MEFQPFPCLTSLSLKGTAWNPALCISGNFLKYEVEHLIGCLKHTTSFSPRYFQNLIIVHATPCDQLDARN